MAITFRHRCLTRSLTHRRCRRLTRRIGRGPRINYLGQALGAFTRAIRAHRHLIRLAPAIFDAAVVRRESAERAEREAIHRAVTVALEKVYGPDPQELHRLQNEKRCSNGAETVQFPRRKEAKLRSCHAEMSLWLATGRMAWDRHQHLRPHQRLSLGTVARMVNVAIQFGRLACGLELQPAKPSKDSVLDCTEAIAFDDALKRVYGARCEGSPVPAVREAGVVI